MKKTKANAMTLDEEKMCFFLQWVHENAISYIYPDRLQFYTKTFAILKDFLTEKELEGLVEDFVVATHQGPPEEY